MSELGEILDTAMAELAMTRPVFHSESDWQFALAWQLQTDLPAARLRLEQPQPVQPRSSSTFSWLSMGAVSVLS